MYKTTPSMYQILLLHMTTSNFLDFFDTLHEAGHGSAQHRICYLRKCGRY